MKYSLMFKSFKLALLNTYRKVHIIPIFVTFMIVIINKFLLRNNEINFNFDNIGMCLNGLSILSIIFVYTIQSMNFKYIYDKSNKEVWKSIPFTNKKYLVTEVNELRYTCYSLSVITFSLIFFVYIFIFTSLFKNYIDIIFLFAIIYIFNALIFMFSVYNAIKSQEVAKG